ncbi:hypothetical protein LWP59_33910 [Amycolatopsis acidiphila]|uniref:Uncharacterized protein n=1 Tax=Amycolatopsis acidiphila TaxID=715473 RepID=A0A558A8X4_9PSEU|nr:hypothetical protein [Amycolatopsis acidiphila]TVT20715.1 hypothetical protein FNH06_19565 [Amycolatopsis acidiphila]UIJ59017.1 hypothetical protein LWP59_33910 [Amycolatopsis acidiphila]GHG73371.1 hypothetical protein GCM10017788_36660 [Amycolatopsis acidiphila]
MTVRLGPFALCPACQARNGGLTHARHRQRHVAARDQAACVDAGLASLLPELWAICRTVSSCRGDDGWAYVTPTPDTREAAAAWFTARRLRHYWGERGRLYFELRAAQQTLDPLLSS